MRPTGMSPSPLSSRGPRASAPKCIRACARAHSTSHRSVAVGTAEYCEDLAVSGTEVRAWSCRIQSASGWEISAGPCSATPTGPGRSITRVRVPELAGFWLLSLLLQLPLILFLLFNEGLTNLPLEKAVHIIFTIFLTFQVVSAFLTLRKMVNQLATRFHLQDFDRLSASRGDMRRVRSCIEEI
ncbi:hypothetical protein R6Z07F_004081 [Ovis aries]|nr:transmembrane protein 17 isoform X2 [Ovis aries]